MKHLAFVHPAGLMILSFLFISCDGNRQGFRHQVLQQIHTQLEQSCLEDSLFYNKVVRDLTAAETIPEDSLFALHDSCTLLDDLKYAYGQCFLEPSLIEYFDVEMRGDTTIARVKSGKEEEVDIQLQKLLFSDPDSTIGYLELIIQKRQFLYDLDAHLSVEFGERGHYLKHKQVVEVVVSGGNHYFAETQGTINRR